MPSEDLELARKVDAVCNRFEQAWRQGTPCIEEFLTDWQEPGRLVLLRELVLLDVDYRQRKGETARAEDYLAQFPELDQTWLAAALSGKHPLSRLTWARGQENLSPQEGPQRGQRIGDYEILEEIARGGMGVVYKARQVSANRLVALKMILSGHLASQSDVDRFRLEAEAAALMDHPGIVPIYEVGMYAGLPFFSMKLVEGGSLAQQRGRFRAPRDVARLIAQVARAVHYAHQRLILHRDLKPGNILLGENGEPLVSDFGLAKRMTSAGDKTGAGGLTQTGAIVGTPDYMAPEQASGETRVLTTATDVYTLGTILFEVLTGRPPFEARDTLDKLLKVRFEQPPSPRSLNPAVHRDLDTICLKCLRKVPSQRYRTAEALAEDLDAFLERRPIQARPVGTWERAWKWARRRPAVAGLLAVIGLLTTAALAAVTYLYRDAMREATRAQEAEHQAEARELDAKASAESAIKNFNLAEARFLEVLRVIDRYFTDVSESTLLHEPGLDPLRQKLLRKARVFYAKFVHEREDDPRLQGELARSQYRLALIDADLGDLPGALRLLDGAQARMARLSAKSKNPALRYDEALTSNHRGRICRLLDRFDEATAAYQKAVGLLEAVGSSTPDSLLSQERLGASYLGLGNVPSVQRQNSAALRHYQRALKIREALIKADPRSETYQRDLAVTWECLAAIYSRVEKKADADKAEAIALESFRRLVKAYPQRALFQADLARTLYNQGSRKAATGEYSSALRCYQEAETIFDVLVRTHPSVASYQQNLGATLLNLTVACQRVGQTAITQQVRLPDGRMVIVPISVTANAAQQKALEIWQKLADDHPEMPAYQANLARILINEGRRLRDARLYPDALKMHNQARLRLEAAMRKPPVNPEYRSLRCQLINAIGNAQDRSGKFVEAERTYQGLLTICAELEQEKLLQPRDEVQRGYACVNIGWLRRASGDPSSVLLWFEGALRVAESLRQRNVEVFGANDIHKIARREQGLILDQLGRSEEALRAWDAVLAREEGMAHRGFQVLRLRTQARMADYQQTIPDVDRLSTTRLHHVDRICLACVYGRLHQSAAKDNKLTPDKCSEIQTKCVRESLRAIEEAPIYDAMSNSFAKKMLESDPDLAHVRQQPEFKKILAKKAPNLLMMPTMIEKVKEPRVIEKKNAIPESLKKIEQIRPKKDKDANTDDKLPFPKLLDENGRKAGNRR
jgi:serine/threonine-protein kinase